jgi:SulP family sulfate permease
VFARVNRYLRADMDRHGITEVIGATHVFETLHEALATLDLHPSVQTKTEL